MEGIVMWLDPVVHQIPDGKLWRSWEWICRYCPAKQKARTRIRAIMDSHMHMRMHIYGKG